MAKPSRFVLKAQLTENVVTNLQNQIDELRENIGTLWDNGLDEDTKKLLGLSPDATPDDAFIKIAFGVGKYAYSLTVVDPDNVPLSGLTVSGLKDVNGNTCVTDENGETIGVSENETVSISISSPYFDLNSLSKTIASTGVLTKARCTLTQKYSQNAKVTLASSITIKFSPRVNEVDFCGVGGGGGGQCNAGGGGGGGYVTNVLNVIPGTDSFKLEIGSGGSGGVYNVTNVGSGGSTKITQNGSTILSASGGSAGTNTYGGKGNGGGGDAKRDEDPNGGSGKVRIFDDSSLSLAGGGGGGAGQGYAGSSNAAGTHAAGSGGSPYGGDGGNYTDDGENGKGPGGGGGGGVHNTNFTPSITNGGSGAAGTVYLRMRYRT